MRFLLPVLFPALLAVVGLPAHAQQMETLWNCKDKEGRTTLTNQKGDTSGKDCRVVHQERVTVVPGPPPAAKPAAKSPTPAGFPRESAADRASSKAKQRDTLDKELVQEQDLLADARKKLAVQEAIRTGDEKNYAKVLERLKPFRDAVEVHEKNVEALKREIGNLNR
jgi:Domain of unknown function (DUF4124)